MPARSGSLSRHSLVGLLGAALGLLSGAAAEAAQWQRLELPALGTYALYYAPAGGGVADPAPAVVFLHGSGALPEHWTFLAELADELGVVLLLPRSGDPAGFGVGPDDAIVAEALRRLGERVAIDAGRVGLAGHSAGGAYAIVLAYTTPNAFNGVFSLAAPYRTVVRLANAGAPAPLRLHYGSEDPNHRNGHHQALRDMLRRLGVEVTSAVAAGYGHNTWPEGALRDGFRFLVQRPVPSCVPGATVLCLRGGRFRVEGEWSTAEASGAAGAVALTEESGYLWFFEPGNVEVNLKVLDGCGVNGRFWVFASGLTDVGVRLTVTDTATAQVWRHESGRGRPFPPVLDTAAFAGCGP